jgi:Tol biopolymer transport system component
MAVPSPDGKTLLVMRDEHPGKRPFTSGLWLVDVEGGNARRTVFPDGSGLRKLAERASQPAFSPDGRLIAFVSDRDEHGEQTVGEDEIALANELYVMKANGRSQRRLTESEGLDEASPAWSPDGSRIAFAREGPARFMKKLMVVSADGTCPTHLIGDASDESIGAPSFDSPTWRPGRLRGDLSPLDCD